MVKKITDSVKSTDEKTRRWKSTFAAARMAYETGEFRQAESLLARAREMAEHLQEHGFALNAVEVGIGAVQLAEGRSSEALAYLQRTVAGLEGSVGNEHKELLAVALRFYAQALIETNDERGGERELQRSITILRGLGEDFLVQLSYSLADLSELYLVTGRHKEAEIYITEAMKIVGRALEPGSPEYTRVDMIYKISRPMPEEERALLVMDGIRRIEYLCGAKHPNVARALKEYFKVLTEQGNQAKLEEAKKMFGV
jgi:tetratricopeptide (TPR) repeat protein